MPPSGSSGQSINVTALRRPRSELNVPPGKQVALLQGGTTADRARAARFDAPLRSSRSEPFRQTKRAAQAAPSGANGRATPTFARKGGGAAVA